MGDELSGNASPFPLHLRWLASQWAVLARDKDFYQAAEVGDIGKAWRPKRPNGMGEDGCDGQRGRRSNLSYLMPSCRSSSKRSSLARNEEPRCLACSPSHTFILILLPWLLFLLPTPPRTTPFACRMFQPCPGAHVCGGAP